MMGGGAGGGGGDDDLIYGELFRGAIEEAPNPRKESFCHFLRSSLSPFFKFNSFCFIIGILCFLYYVFLLVVGIDIEANTLLTVKDSTISRYGGFSYAEKILRNKLHIYTYIVNAFIIRHAYDLLFNFVILFFIGPIVEKLTTWYKILIIYFVSNILGNLFFADCAPKDGRILLSSGMSISLYGILGSHFGYCTLNGKKINRIFGFMGKCLYIYFMIFFCIFIFLIDMMNYDYKIICLGNLGGLIFGYFLGLAVPNPVSPDAVLIGDGKYWKIIPSLIIGLFGGLSLGLLYGLAK